MKKFVKGFFTTLLVLVITAVVLAAAGVIYLTVNEYKPEDIEVVETYGLASKSVSPSDTITLLTYNIGYGADDDKHDFFMDGGKTVTTESADNITANINGIIETINKQDADVNFIQEVDIDSKRSYNIDEANLISGAFPESNIAFATNFLCAYIPYPITDNIGKVNAGILTVNKFNADIAERISLSDGFTWPVSTCQLKRCLLIEKVQLLDSTKELVLINLHLDAYDDGEGKETQYKELCEYMQLEYAKGNYVIAGGDFNGILPSVDKSKYPLVNTEYYEPATIPAENLTGGWKYCTDDSIPSSRLLNEPYDKNSENTQYYVIDGFICSPNTIVESTKTIDTEFKYSDHNPVVITVDLVS